MLTGFDSEKINMSGGLGAAMALFHAAVFAAYGIVIPSGKEDETLLDLGSIAGKLINTEDGQYSDTFKTAAARYGSIVPAWIALVKAREVEAALDVFRQTYQKVVPGADGVTPGTEDVVMIEIRKFVFSEFVLSKHKRNLGVTERNLGVTEERANKYMPILKAWKEVEKARVEVANANNARLEADEADQASFEAV